MIKVLFICAGGISTSFLEQRTKKAFDAQGIDVRILARSVSTLDNYIDNVDIVLLAPQVAYMKDDVAEFCRKHNKKLVEIPMLIYGRMDGQAIMALILDNLEEGN